MAGKIRQTERIIALAASKFTCPTTLFAEEGTETQRERDPPNRHHRSLAEPGSQCHVLPTCPQHAPSPSVANVKNQAHLSSQHFEVFVVIWNTGALLDTVKKLN